MEGSCLETVAKHRKPRRNRGRRGSKPQEYYSYFEDFEPKPDNEFGRKPKFCSAAYIDSLSATFSICTPWTSEAPPRMAFATWTASVISATFEPRSRQARV